MDEDQISRSVFDEALQILNDLSKWQKQIEYGEDCDPNAKKYSLGCAMEKAMIKIKGTYDDRGREMRSLRWKIYFNYFWRAGIHPVTYFNRSKKTKYEDVIKVIEKARRKFE